MIALENTDHDTGALRQIPVSIIEFREGGNTLWVHSNKGHTVLRIECQTITVDKLCNNVGAHADLLIDKPIDFCIPAEEPDFKPSAEIEVIRHLLVKHQGLTAKNAEDQATLLVANINEINFILEEREAGGETHTN